MTEPVARQLGSTGRVLAWLARVAQFVAVIAMIVMTVIIGWQIFGRFVLNDTPKWSEQLAGIIMVYLMLIGGAVAVWENRHIALDVLLNALPAGGQRVVRLLIYALLALFGAMMVVYGIEMAGIVRAWTVPTLGVSKSVNYWAFPVAGALICAFSLAFIVYLLRGGEMDEDRE